MSPELFNLALQTSKDGEVAKPQRVPSERSGGFCFKINLTRILIFHNFIGIKLIIIHL
jgi:hypothetical protein